MGPLPGILMRIRMLQSAASSLGALTAGQELEVSPEQGAAWVGCGLAVAVRTIPDEETAVLDGAPEKAVLSRRQKRGG